jgi:hypothetical protein
MARMITMIMMIIAAAAIPPIAAALSVEPPESYGKPY